VGYLLFRRRKYKRFIDSGQLIIDICVSLMIDVRMYRKWIQIVLKLVKCNPFYLKSNWNSQGSWQLKQNNCMLDFCSYLFVSIILEFLLCMVRCICTVSYPHKKKIKPLKGIINIDCIVPKRIVKIANSSPILLLFNKIWRTVHNIILFFIYIF
jgi:hypothetical protein